MVYVQITGRSTYSEMDTRTEQLARIQSQEQALANEHTELANRDTRSSQAAVTESSALHALVQEHAALVDATTATERATQQLVSGRFSYRHRYTLSRSIFLPNMLYS